MTRVLRLSLLTGFALLVSSGVALGQVFTQDPGADVGIVTQGTGQALYGDFGLNSATDPEFKIYRKFLEVTSEPLSSATNVDGNLGEAKWIDVNQRQSGNLAGEPKNVLTAPGMFIGQKNHVTDDGWVVSNPDEILYFKPLIDQYEDQTALDENRYANWDTRFGFMEDPDSYVDYIAPNSNQTDLWTGRFDTDAVYAQIAINRNNTVDDGNVRTALGHGGSIKLQAGDPETEITTEQDRDNYEGARRTVGTDEEVAKAGLSNAGVAYDDPIEVTWGMKLANPESDDADEKRVVEFWIKTGNIISSGQFDPGDEDNLPFDDINFNDLSDYTDGFFDWTKAKPVFFAGAQGLTGSEGNMGIFIPGDFGADGSVDASDFARLAGDYGGSGTTYSRGDLNQDGTTDEADATAWAALAGNDAKVAALDAVKADVGGTLYDFDGSGATGDEDITFATTLLGITDVCVNNGGDIDGSGTVDFADFLVLSGNFGNDGDSASGDIDCDGKVEFSDFLILSGNFGKDIAGAQSVPEPSGAVLLAIAGLAWGLVRRRR